MKHLLGHISYSVASNFVSLLISISIVAVLPKALGVEDYGYFQVYLFYVGYVGFFHGGWIDGIYLRYGGRKYDELDRVVFRSQFYMLAATQVLFAAVLGAYSCVTYGLSDRGFVVLLVCVCLVVTNLRGMLSYILQATFRIGHYAVVLTVGRVAFFALAVGSVVAGVGDYRFVVLADVVGNFISALVAIYCCRDIVCGRIRRARLSVAEAWLNVSVGVKLMVSSFANILIIGVVRWGIEQNWTVATFGKVSLAISVSNLMTVFVSAVGVVVFPVLKRAKVESLPRIYAALRTAVTAPVYGILILYYPVKMVLAAWLPEYAASLKYLALVFPICVYASKTYLLGNSYLNALRKERTSMIINLGMVGLAVPVMYVTTFVVRDLDMAVASLVVLSGIRAVVVDVFLAYVLSLKVVLSNVYESALSVVFVYVSWSVGSWEGLLMYIGAYVMYLLLTGRDVCWSYGELKCQFDAGGRRGRLVGGRHRR